MCDDDDRALRDATIVVDDGQFSLVERELLPG